MKGITIGSYVWMEKDLVADHLQNEDPIYEAISDKDMRRCCDEGVPAF